MRLPGSAPRWVAARLAASGRQRRLSGRCNGGLGRFGLKMPNAHRADGDVKGGFDILRESTEMRQCVLNKKVGRTVLAWTRRQEENRARAAYVKEMRGIARRPAAPTLPAEQGGLSRTWLGCHRGAVRCKAAPMGPKSEIWKPAKKNLLKSDDFKPNEPKTCFR